MVVANHESIIAGLSDWTRDEHARLHAPGDSVMTSLETMRAASALPFDDPNNTSVLKTQQHLRRTKLRISGLAEAEFDVGFTGRALSDCFKLIAGQQVKRFMAQAKDQDDFTALLLEKDPEVYFSVWAAMNDLRKGAGESTITEELDLLGFKLEGSLKEISLRAADGGDWGEEQSGMVEAAWLGEVACSRMALSTIGYLAVNLGGFDNVPLRLPASDAKEAPIVYPFTD